MSKQQSAIITTATTTTATTTTATTTAIKNYIKEYQLDSFFNEICSFEPMAEGDFVIYIDDPLYEISNLLYNCVKILKEINKKFNIFKQQFCALKTKKEKEKHRKKQKEFEKKFHNFEESWKKRNSDLLEAIKEAAKNSQYVAPGVLGELYLCISGEEIFNLLPEDDIAKEEDPIMRITNFFENLPPNTKDDFTIFFTPAFIDKIIMNRQYVKTFVDDNNIDKDTLDFSIISFLTKIRYQKFLNILENKIYYIPLDYPSYIIESNSKEENHTLECVKGTKRLLKFEPENVHKYWNPWFLKKTKYNKSIIDCNIESFYLELSSLYINFVRNL